MLTEKNKSFSLNLLSKEINCYQKWIFQEVNWSGKIANLHHRRSNIFLGQLFCNSVLLKIRYLSCKIQSKSLSKWIKRDETGVRNSMKQECFNHLIAEIRDGNKKPTSCRRPRNRLNPDVDILVGERRNLFDQIKLRPQNTSTPSIFVSLQYWMQTDCLFWSFLVISNWLVFVAKLGKIPNPKPGSGFIPVYLLDLGYIGSLQNHYWESLSEISKEGETEKFEIGLIWFINKVVHMKKFFFCDFGHQIATVILLFLHAQ